MTGVKTSSNANIPGHNSPGVLHLIEWQIEYFGMNAREIGRVQGLSLSCF
jgi:hypothetical protein